MLLITLDYDQKIMNGPPFSVTQKEVNKLFSFAKVKQLHRSDIIEQEPAFKKRGLTRFYETVYSIEW
jgi:thiopurine S-methyltransferase